jgi:hypothetical protein
VERQQFMYEKECKRNRIKVDDKGEDGKKYCIIENRKIEKETKREQIG